MGKHLIFLLGVDYLLNVVILKGKVFTLSTTINKGAMNQTHLTINSISLLSKSGRTLSLTLSLDCSIK